MQQFDDAAEPQYVYLQDGKIRATQYTLDELQADRRSGNASRILRAVVRETADLMNEDRSHTLSRQAGSVIYDLERVSGSVTYDTAGVLSSCRLEQTAPLKRGFSESFINGHIHSFGMDRALRVIPAHEQPRKRAARRPSGEGERPALNS